MRAKVLAVSERPILAEIVVVAELVATRFEGEGGFLLTTEAVVVDGSDVDVGHRKEVRKGERVTVKKSR